MTGSGWILGMRHMSREISFSFFFNLLRPSNLCNNYAMPCFRATEAFQLRRIACCQRRNSLAVSPLNVNDTSLLRQQFPGASRKRSNPITLFAQEKKKDADADLTAQKLVPCGSIYPVGTFSGYNFVSHYNTLSCQ